MAILGKTSITELNLITPLSNANLENSKITINGTAVPLGGSYTYTPPTATTSTYGVIKIDSGTTSNFLYTLDTGTSNPSDNTWYITSVSSGTGTTFYKRSHSYLYGYLKGKFDGVYQPKGDYLTSQNTSKNIVGASTTATANASGTNGNVYLNHLENSSVTSTHKISGATGISVTSDGNGNITITGTEYQPKGDYLTSQNTSKNVIASAGTGTSDVKSITNGNVWLNHLEDSTVTSKHNIKGSGSVTVTTDANGALVISGTPHTTDTNTYTTGATGNGNGTVTFTRNNGTTWTWNAAHTHSYWTAATATTSAYGISKLVNGDLSGYTDTTVAATTGLAAAAYHTHSQYSTTDEKVKTAPLGGMKFYLVGSVATGTTTSILGKDENAYVAGGNLYVQNGKKVATEEYLDESLEIVAAAANDLNDRIQNIENGAPIIVDKVMDRFELGGFSIRDWDDGRSELHLSANVSSGIYANDNAIYTLNGFYQTSDERKKNFGKDIDVDFDKLKEIPKSYFTWKDDENQKLNIGTSAQKVAEIYPELVTYDEHEDEYSVSYAQLSIVALKAVDKLYEENQMLKEELAMIKKHLGL